MAANDFPKTLTEAVRYFSDPEICREFVAQMRWPDGVTCPREGCGSRDVSFYSNRGVWRCKGCKKQFSVKVGTIFEDSPIGLDKWLPALWLVTSSKKGISSYQIARSLGVTQKTAWFMDHRLRYAMRTESFNKPLDGEVEVDETFVGGKAKFMHKAVRERRIKGRGGAGSGKAVVMGMIQRKGEVRAVIVSNNRRATLQGRIRANVAPGSTVYTDALMSYRGIDREYVHEVIDHAEKYVEGRVHTNGMENFWSLLKRGIVGIYHSVHEDHLDRYLDEFAYRFNTRKQKDGERFVNAAARVSGKRLTYAELIAKG
jgi:transposase-like protein